MSKKYWYGLLGTGAIVLFVVFILVFRKEETVRQEKVTIKVEELIQKNRESEALDLIVKTFIEKRPDYESVGKLGGHLISLSSKDLDRIFSRALNKYPQYTDELNIGWAWVLSRKYECEQALDKIIGSVAEDSFWESVKQDILDKCKTQ